MPVSNWTGIRLWLPAAGFSARRLLFDARPVSVRPVMDEVHWDGGFFRVLWICHLSIAQPMLCAHLHLHSALTRRSSRRSLELFKQNQHTFGNRGVLKRKEVPVGSDISPQSIKTDMRNNIKPNSCVPN